MILRKPYAFLMKHFRKINFILLLCTIYIFVLTLELLGYVNDYARANTNIVDMITNMFSGLYFFVLVVIIAITGVLLYLLKRKDKPIKTYVIILAEYIILLFLGMYLNSYFGDFIRNGYDKAMARTIQGFVLITSLPQYVILLLLVIRTIGLDLNSFGFKHDKEFMTSEEDREEVEVDVGFDPDKFKRNVRMYFRKIKYFVVEHKAHVLIVCGLVFAAVAFSTYRYFYVTNKVYKIGQVMESNYYNFRVNHSYITTKDYRGDVINAGKSYVIIDLDVKNTLTSTRTLDIGKFILYVDDDYYVPTINYNNHFEDLGPVFKGLGLEGKASANYYLIFEINTPKENSEFLLKYQDLVSHSKLIRIKLKIKDISEFVLKDTKSLMEEIVIPINKVDTKKINITSYEIGSEYPYTYEQCYMNNCPIRGGYTAPGSGRRVLYMKLDPFDSSTQDLLQVFVRYGKMRYVIDGVTYTENVKSHVTKVYKGNFFYFDVSSQIEFATGIEIVLTIRNNQYVYKLK